MELLCWDCFSGVGELILCVHLCHWPWRGLEVDSGAAGGLVKPSNYPSVFVQLCDLCLYPACPVLGAGGAEQI